MFAAAMPQICLGFYVSWMPDAAVAQLGGACAVLPDIAAGAPWLERR